MKKELILPDYVKKEEPTGNVTPFKALPGGKGPEGSDWLSGMSRNAIFLVKPKNQKAVDLLECHVLYQLKHSTYILKRIADQEIVTYVVPENFCNTFDLHEVISEGDEDDSGTVHPEGVEPTEGSEGVDSVHEDKAQ